MIVFAWLLLQVCALPDEFVYLRDVDSSIIQEIRYAGYHNFIGHPIRGYKAAECILTSQAARKLSKAQSKAISLGYSLKVYDCYRPQKAVDEFIEWSMTNDQKMKQEFYPSLEKKQIFEEEYLFRRSNHTRGSTMDLTLVSIPLQIQEVYHDGDPLKSCESDDRFKDNTINMGTGFDCISEMSWTDRKDISKVERQNRKLLQKVMEGFENYEKEWWHYTLKDQPREEYFDFDIE